MSGKAPSVLVGAVLALFVLTALAVGSWWGFPVQDDTYMIRLLRLGGADLIIQEYPDRPIVGFLVATCVRFAGEHRALYIAIALVFWSLLAAQAIRLWVLVFPEWTPAWPAVALAVVAPVVTLVQFTTVTTVFPCVLPVTLVLGALLCLLGRADVGAGSVSRIAAVFLVAAAAVVSEYALATVAAAATLLLLLRRWRGTITILGGVSLGYAVFRAISDVRLRASTDPGVQLAALSSKLWSRTFNVLAATWHCMAGSWGRALYDFQITSGSKSTLFAAAVALAVAGCAASLGVGRHTTDRPEPVGRRLLAVIAAVAAGLAPTIFVLGWPLHYDFSTRYFLPELVFASCGAVALLLAFGQPRLGVLAVFLVSFLAADRLVLGAFEEKALQAALERFGERLRPFVGQDEGLLVLVSTSRKPMHVLEAMAKATYRWSFPEAGRLEIVEPGKAKLLLGPRSGCRSAESLRLSPRGLRWPRPAERIRLVMWDASSSGDPDPEPYFRGCPNP
jgi:hypothetical protein